MFKSIFAAATACVLLAVVPSSAERFSAQQGEMWLSGGFSLNSTGVSYDGKPYDDRLTMLTLSPTLRFFPTNYFSIGPKISWLGLFMGGEDPTHALGFGGELGFVYGGPVLPYIFVGPQATGSVYTTSEYDYSADDFRDVTETDWSFTLPFSLGAVIPVAENIGVQLEFGLSYGFNQSEKVNSNQFSIGFGVCGLGKKAAVSALSTMGILNSIMGL